jgi:hypothetical protein
LNTALPNYRQVNYHLIEGHYFFSDIKKEGILLYDSGKLKLERIRKPGPAPPRHAERSASAVEASGPRV